MNSLSSFKAFKNRGFILITTLILLIMLSILGMTEVSVNTTQTQIATNSTDSEISFEKTEGTMNEAINKMLSNAYDSSVFLQNSNGLYLYNQSATPLWQTIDWTSSAAIHSFSGLSGLQANYIIEQLPSVVKPGQNMKATTYVYRITGKAVGQNGSSSVLLQSTLQIQQ